MTKSKSMAAQDIQPKIVFLGTPQFAAIILEILANSPFRPMGVISEPDKPVGRTQIVTPPAVKTTALAHGLPVSQPASHMELLEILRFWQPDLIIVAAYGRILRPDVLALPHFGIVNIHPSLLPKYRGATPIQAAILAGDQTTGVSLMLIEEGVDTGPILAQQSASLNQTDTTITLGEHLAQLGGKMLLQTLPHYLSGELRAQPQTTSDDSVTNLITKENGRLDGTHTPDQVLRMLRAYTPWPGVWAEIEDNRILLHSAHVADGHLIPDIVQLAGKQPVDWKTFARDRAEIAQKFLQFLAPNS